MKRGEGGFDSGGEDMDNLIEGKFADISRGVLQAREEIDKMGGVDALKEQIRQASGQTREGLRVLCQLAPLSFVVFAALGLAPIELGSLLGEATVVANPDAFMPHAAHTPQYLEAAKFGLEASGVLGAGIASMMGSVGIAKTVSSFFEQIKLGALKRKAKV